MDIENLKCPQFVDFNSEDFKASLSNETGLDVEMDSSNELNPTFSDSLEESLRSPVDQKMINSLTESQISEEHNEEISFGSEEQFTIHARVSRSQAAMLRKQATVPKPFHFQTDSRLKNADGVSNEAKKDFTSQLRQHKAYAVKSGATKVKPFKLTEPKTKKGEGSYLSLAEQIIAFQKKTPERFHTTSQKEYQPQQHWSPPKLRPRTPKLQAIKRSRPVDVLSREEQEEKEAQEMKKYEFHARPVDPRVYKPKHFENYSKKNTKAKNVELQTSKRARSKETLLQPENTHTFIARPVPKSILKGTVGLGEKPEVFKTIPKSPKFESDRRLAKRKLLEQESEVIETPAKKVKKEIKKKQTSVPKNKKKPQRPKRTEIKPFSFDEIDKERYLQKEIKIKGEIEKENKPFVFKAQGMPLHDKPVLPNIKKKSVTTAKPFSFTLDLRNHSPKLLHEEQDVSFKARPATVLSKSPFIPEKPHRFITETSGFNLQTDRRASERLKQKIEKEAEDLENQKIHEKQKALEEEKEQQEIQKLRQELVHKANPIREYKPLEIKRSTKPLTTPMSPKFKTDERLKNKNETLRDV